MGGGGQTPHVLGRGRRIRKKRPLAQLSGTEPIRLNDAARSWRGLGDTGDPDQTSGQGGEAFGVMARRDPGAVRGWRKGTVEL